jgi:hypothetical protein
MVLDLSLASKTASSRMGCGLGTAFDLTRKLCAKFAKDIASANPKTNKRWKKVLSISGDGEIRTLESIHRRLENGLLEALLNLPSDLKGIRYGG